MTTNDPLRVSLKAMLYACACGFLALAVLSFVVDKAEYPGLSHAAIRAFVRQTLPLLIVAGVNFVGAWRPSWLWIAVIANVFFLSRELTTWHPASPVFFQLHLGMTVLATLVSAACLFAELRRPKDKR